MNKQQLSRAMSALATERWKGVKKSDRVAHAKKMVNAREAKKLTKKHGNIVI